MPMVAELMETCIDDILRAPGIPTVTATDEAGPSNTYANPSVTMEDSLSLSGEAASNLTHIPRSEFSVTMKIIQKPLMGLTNLKILESLF